MSRRSAAARANCATALPRRRRAGDAMAAYDRLPPELRAWLARAALPWSPRSAARAWARALTSARGDKAAALGYLHAQEARRLAADAARLRGAAHPAAGGARGDPPCPTTPAASPSRC